MDKALRIIGTIFFLTSLLSILGCNGGKSQSETNKAIVRDYAREEDQGSKDFIDKYVDPDFVFHYPNGREFRGIEKLKKGVINFQTAFPDGYHHVEDQIAEGDKVATRYTWTGTHTSEYMGVAPTGKQLKFTMIDICRIKNGKIVEAWIEFDPSAFNLESEN